MKSARALLYVDDEKHNLTTFEETFRDYYRIHTALSGEEAQAVLQKEEIQILIVDQVMPGITGLQLLEVVRNPTSGNPDMIGIILTGHPELEVVDRAVRQGRVYQYITKPWKEKPLKLLLDRSFEYYELRTENRELHDRIEQYAARSESYLQQGGLDQNNEDLFLGERRVVSVLFSDIRGFTKLSSQNEPQVVVDFLNIYFSMMSDIVSSHSGSVNKFVGDGMVAVFGAPVASSLYSAKNSVMAALDMVDALAEFNQKEANKLIGQEIRIGIGINHGETIAGVIGSDKKMEYTVIGNTVNVAARIEELTKKVPNSILISQSVYNDLGKDQFKIEPQEPVLLRGLSEETPIYRVLSRHQP